MICSCVCLSYQTVSSLKAEDMSLFFILLKLLPGIALANWRHSASVEKRESGIPNLLSDPKTTLPPLCHFSLLSVRLYYRICLKKKLKIITEIITEVVQCFTAWYTNFLSVCKQQPPILLSRIAIAELFVNINRD